MSPKAYERRPLWAICHPYPKGSIPKSKYCGVVRIEEPGLYWIFAELAWSDHYDDRVLYVSVNLSPKKS